MGLVLGLFLWTAAGKGPAAEPDLARFGPPERRVRLTYAVRLRDLPQRPESVAAWIPLPRDHAFQTLESWALLEEYPAEQVEDEELGNGFLRLDLTSAARHAVGSPLPVTLEATVTRRAYSAWRRDAASSLPAPPLDRFLQPNRLVPTDGFIAAEARRVVGRTGEPLRKARRLYDHVVRTLSYDKSGEGWGLGDAVYACDARTGNCTDFHSLFIAEARSVDVPARFLIGLPLPAGETGGTIGGYHCWAEFWVDGRGWVPVDASEAHKRPELQELFFGSLDAHRVELTVGRDLDLPGAAVEDLNFVVYPHVEVDGVLHEAVETELRFRDLPHRVAARASEEEERWSH
jgi:transglutaminase-like putative cysteine protease